MLHLGDITQLHGDQIPVVDIITGGSPCQDLSVAGKRAGFAGERSGLFMEQIRIVKEMRERDRRAGRTAWLIRPRFMVWENVPGAFSSNKGRDFQAVLSEIVKIAEPDAPDVPLPESGKWPKAGCLYSDVGDWSIAWRVHDAQFWGVPQRRKRIALVADFGGLSAPEILFERKGLSRDSEPCGTAGQGASTSTAIGTGSTGSASGIEPVPIEGNGQRESHRGNGYGNGGDPMFTLNSTEHHAVAAEAYGICSYDSNAMKSPNPNSGFYKADTSRTLDLNGGNPACNQGGVAVVEVAEPTVYNGENVTSPLNKTNPQPGDPCHTLGTDTRNYVVEEVAAAWFSFGQSAKARSIGFQEEVSPTLRGGEGGNQKPCVLDATSGADDYKEPQMVYDAGGNGDGKTVCTITGDHQNRVTDYTALCVGNEQLNQMSMTEQCNTLDTMHDHQAVMVAAVDCRNASENATTNGTLQAKSNGDISCNLQNVCRTGQTVRRLTPLECERLQGFPDGYTDIGEWVDTKGKKHKPADSPRYKALGNSIALPFWAWLARRICAMYERPVTIGSLFDGIGGFPLVFSRCGAIPVWASEIEEFQIAVTKRHFQEKEG